MSLSNFSNEYLNSPSLSNTDLSYFLKSPKKFKAYKEREYEEESSGYSFGDLVHTAVLEPEKYNEKYIEEPEGLVKPSHAQHKSFVDGLLVGESLDTAYDNSFKSKGKAKEDKIEELYGLYKDYIDFMKKARGKEVVSAKDKERLMGVVQSLAEHPGCAYFLLNDSKDIITFREKEIIDFEYEGIIWKSKVDKITINENRKVIIITDLKTTGYPVHTFRTSFTKYSYYRQQALYGIAVIHFLKKNNIIDDLKGYNVIYNCIAVESDYPYEAKVFHSAPSVIAKGEEEIKQAVSLYKWHVENGVWNMTKQEYESPYNYEIIDETIFE